MLRIEINKWPTEFVDPHFDGFFILYLFVSTKIRGFRIIKHTPPDTRGGIGHENKQKTTQKTTRGDEPKWNSLCFLVTQVIRNVILKNTPEMKSEQQ